MEKVRDRFFRTFGDGTGGFVAQAPGRVNLIGEHTDYNAGLVLPTVIDRSLTVALRPRDDRRLHLAAVDLSEWAELELGSPPAPDAGNWVRYLAGAIEELAAEHGIDRGVELLVTGDVPRGAGLSSSAALGVATTMAWGAAFDVDLDVLQAARTWQRVEHRHAGVRVGIMDPLVCRAGRSGHALLIDCLDEQFRYVPLGLGDHRIVIVDSGVRRELCDSAYNRRREECEEAVRRLQAVDPSVTTLRDVTADRLGELAGQLPEPLQARVRHVVGENDRVRDAVRRLEERDLAGFGELLGASHTSLRDDFEVSHPALDRLVTAAEGVDGVLGARMTGGGFGGSTVNLVAVEALEALQQAVAEQEPAGFWVIRHPIEAAVGPL